MTLLIGVVMSAAGWWAVTRLGWGPVGPIALPLFQLPATVWLLATLARISERIDWDRRPIRSHRVSLPAPEAVMDEEPMAEVVPLHEHREIRKAA